MSGGYFLSFHQSLSQAIVQSTVISNIFKSQSCPRVGLQSTAYFQLQPPYALAISHTPSNSFVAVCHTPHNNHPLHPSNHHWLLNASDFRSTNQPCRRAHHTAPTARTRVPTHPVPPHPPHVCCLVLSDYPNEMFLTHLQLTLLLPRAYTQTPVARHAAKRTANHPSSTMEVERSTTRIRRRPRRMGDTTSRQDVDCLEG
jgi:hypothetical protein